MTKVCIFGAGAIGGYIAACLKKTDVEISLVARGPHKKAIEEKGLTFVKNDKSEKISIPLKHGTLLIMGGEMQHFWQHSAPKRKKIKKARVNLTFRKIK